MGGSGSAERGSERERGVGGWEPQGGWMQRWEAWGDRAQRWGFGVEADIVPFPAPSPQQSPPALTAPHRRRLLVGRAHPALDLLPPQLSSIVPAGLRGGGTASSPAGQPPAQAGTAPSPAPCGTALPFVHPPYGPPTPTPRSPTPQPPTPTPRPPTPHLCFGRPRTAEDAVVAAGVGQSHVGQSGRGQQQRRQRPLRVRVAQRRVDPLHRQQPCGDGRLWGSAPRGRVPHGARRAAGLPAPSRGDLAWHNSRSVSSCTEALVAFTLSWMSVQLRNSAPSFLSCSFSCSKASKYLQKGGRGGMWGRAEGLGDLRGLSNLTEPRRGHRWTDGWAAVGWGWGGLDLEGSSKLSDAAGEWAQSGRGLTAGRGGGPLQPEQLHEGVKRGWVISEVSSALMATSGQSWINGWMG